MPWLTDDQLDYLCEGLTREQKTRRCAYLRGLGLHVIESPGGHPRVLVSNVEAVLGGAPAAAGVKVAPAPAQPDRAAFVAHYGKKKVAA